ncbi:MAG TPA: hypothetical protein VER33_05000 [Polyangiaceae bacterium]|nr:hypothetical protein [Polyangiaceae bacterium]
MAAPPPAPPNPAEVVLTFLESVGRRSEAELYLRLFRKLPKQSFAVIAPGGPVIRQALGSLVEQLRFLADLDLFAPIVLGLFDPESAEANSERLLKRLPGAGLDPCPHEMSEPDLASRLAAELCAERVPIVRFPSSGQSFAERVASFAAMTRALDTRKVVLLRRRGGIVQRRDRPTEPGLALSKATPARVSVINLRNDLEALLASRRLGKRDGELVEMANALIPCIDATSLFVSVTSPLNLLKELFTVKGAGTLIKRGTAVERRTTYTELDAERLRALLESSFGKPLVPDFFARKPLAIYIEAAYRGAAVLIDEPVAPYLSKFAVEPEAQGEGIGNDLWHTIQRDFPRLFWRGRPDNPINSWYESVCDGMLRTASWNVFWRGVEPGKIPALVERAGELPSDFSSPKEASLAGVLNP